MEKYLKLKEDYIEWANTNQYKPTFQRECAKKFNVMTSALSSPEINEKFAKKEMINMMKKKNEIMDNGFNPYMQARTREEIRYIEENRPQYLFRFSEDGDLWAGIDSSFDGIEIEYWNVRTGFHMYDYEINWQQALNQEYTEPINWFRLYDDVWAVYESEDISYSYGYLRLSDPDEELTTTDPRSGRKVFDRSGGGRSGSSSKKKGKKTSSSGKTFRRFTKR